MNGKRLADHPDKAFKENIIKGLRRGFRIGFRHGRCKCVAAKTNMLSAVQNPAVVDQYIRKAVSLGKVKGPMMREQLPEAQVRFGVIEKPHQPGKYHLVVDLSHPEGLSVNDGIESDLCSLQYTSVDAAVTRVLANRQQEVMLAKFDIESAYRTVPVHPEDRHLLGMVWKGCLYIDTVLPFGLRLAPKIFNALADALQWMLEGEGLDTLHYLDDFLVIGERGRPASRSIQLALNGCSQEGLSYSIASCSDEATPQNQTKLGVQIGPLLVGYFSVRLEWQKYDEVRVQEQL